jgi:hypothetical protein
MSEFVVAAFLTGLIETTIAPLFEPIKKKIEVVLREVFNRLKNNKDLPKDILKAPLNALSEQDILTIKKIVAETLSDFSIPISLTYKEFEKQLVKLRKEQESLATELRVSTARILQGLSMLGTSQAVTTQQDLLIRKQFALAVKQYQDDYLDILERAVTRGLAKFPYFIATPHCVLFPNKNGKYPQIEAVKDLKLSVTSGKFPILLEPSGIEVRENKLHFLPTKIEQPLPFLPLKNGYIHEKDFETCYPSRVEDYPSKAFNGEYYWVKPSGLRAVVARVWVWNPNELGMAIWWRYNQRCPLATIAVVKKEEEKKIEVSEHHYDLLLSEYRRLKEILDGTTY